MHLLENASLVSGDFKLTQVYGLDAGEKQCFDAFVVRHQLFFYHLQNELEFPLAVHLSLYSSFHILSCFLQLF